MRCKLHDHVIVIRGTTAGASGTIVEAAPEWARRDGLADWMVEFPDPMPCYHSTTIELRTSNLVGHSDQDLLPVNPPADPVSVEAEQELTA